jgi:hypothetical protein
VEKMKELLSSAKYEETLEPLHGDVKAFYSIPVPEFQGLLLEKRGYIAETCKAVCCHTCRRSIMRDALPGKAIANGNAVGELPVALRDLKSLEWIVVSAVHARTNIITAVSNGAKSLKGHAIGGRSQSSQISKVTLPVRDPHIPMHIHAHT